MFWFSISSIGSIIFSDSCKSSLHVLYTHCCLDLNDWFERGTEEKVLTKNVWKFFCFLNRNKNRKYNFKNSDWNYGNFQMKYVSSRQHLPYSILLFTILNIGHNCHHTIGICYVGIVVKTAAIVIVTVR